MPIYEYQCKSCGHTMEALQKINDGHLVDCPNCKESTLKKNVTAAGFRLKGGGWYETDFKTGDNKKNLVGGAGNSNSDSSKSDSASTKPSSSEKSTASAAS